MTNTIPLVMEEVKKMDLGEEEFERLQVCSFIEKLKQECLTHALTFDILQTQLLELKTSNYTLEDAAKRKDHQITQMSLRLEELEKELSKLQKVAKLNPLTFARNLASRKDAKDKEQLRQQMDSQEEEFKMTNETLRMEIYTLISENQKLREWIEKKDLEDGNEFLKSLEPQENPSNNIPSSPKRDSVDGVHLHLNHQQVNHFQHELEMTKLPSLPRGTLPPLSAESMVALTMEKERLQSQLVDLGRDLKQLSEEKISLMTKYEELKVDCASLKTRVTEAESLAEEKQLLMDAMHDNLEESRSQFKGEVDSLKEKLESSSSQVKSLETTIKQLEDTIHSNTTTIESLEKEKHVLSNEIEALKGKLTMQEKEFEQKIQSLKDAHEEEMKAAVEQHENQVQSLQESLTAANKQISDLSQQVKDSVEERKIHEKKGVMMMKELKRTLAAEKKRAENLQEKLREVLNDPGFGAGDLSLNLTSQSGSGSHSSPGTSTPIKSPSSSRDASQSFSGTAPAGDTSSVGSWSFIPSFKNKKTSPGSNYSNGSDGASGVVGITSARSKVSPVDIDDLSETATLSVLESENSQLVQRITDLQQDKWKLEEKINLLSIEVESLKKDNEVKGQIIEYYCMEGRAGATVSSSTSAFALSSSGTSSSNHHHHQSSSSGTRRESASSLTSNLNHSYHSSSSPSASTSDSHHNKLSVKKVVGFIKDRSSSISDSHVSQEKEINRRLQRMLEETLTKNMFLQKDLESLSNEVVRLSKESVTAPVVSPNDVVTAASSSYSYTSSSSASSSTGQS